MAEPTQSDISDVKSKLKSNTDARIVISYKGKTVAEWNVSGG